MKGPHMPRLSRKLPSYRLHRNSGQGVVTLSGRDHYLGPFGTEESHKAYERTMAAWLANQGQRASRSAKPTSISPSHFSTSESTIVSIDALFVAYWDFAKTYYVKNGRPTSSLGNIKAAYKFVHLLCGTIAPGSFGPLVMKAVRQTMIDAGLSRTTINDYIDDIRRLFRWATENEFVDPSIYQGLRAVSGLKRSRSPARETVAVKPISSHIVDTTIHHVSKQIAAMLRLQALSGMRPEEVCMMKGEDLDTSDSVWSYTPQSHKTEHHQRRRVVFLGPRAQQVLRPLLKHDLSAYLFNPTEAESSRNCQRREQRQSRMTPSQALRSAKANPKRTPGHRYTTASYRRAIHRACDNAFPPPVPICRRPGETSQEWKNRLTADEKTELQQWQRKHRWSPNRLRHNAGTELRKVYGVEASRVVLGHSSTVVTEMYAEIDFEKAKVIMGEVG